MHCTKRSAAQVSLPSAVRNDTSFLVLLAYFKKALSPDKPHKCCNLNYAIIVKYMIENTNESTQTTPSTKADLNKQRLIVVVVIAAILLILTGLGFAVNGLMQDSATTAKIRDIFLIFMAFESLIIGAAMVILVIQVASLVNLLQNEVRPILKSTSETVDTLRGTTAFLSENMVEPVIKLNSYLAGLKKLTDLMGIKKK